MTVIIVDSCIDDDLKKSIREKLTDCDNVVIVESEEEYIKAANNRLCANAVVINTSAGLIYKNIKDFVNAQVIDTVNYFVANHFPRKNPHYVKNNKSYLRSVKKL